MDNAFLNRTSLSNPNAAILEPTHTAARGNALDKLLKQMPALGDMQAVVVDCPIHGKNTWHVPTAEAEAGNVQCQKCRWDADTFATLQREKRDELLHSIDMPEEHIGADFSQWRVFGDEALRERLAKIIAHTKNYAKNYAKGDANILLSGNTGTGKTKLACLIANEIVRHRYSASMCVVFKRSGQIQQEIKATWDKSSKDTEAAYLERISRATVLIIDEVGESDTGFSPAAAAADRERLSSIIDRRYQLRLPTIITTNMTSDEFYKHVGDRAADRLRQNMVDIPCVWVSYRMLTSQVVTL